MSRYLMQEIINHQMFPKECLYQMGRRPLEGTGLVLAAREAWRPREVQHRTGIIGTSSLQAQAPSLGGG